MRIVPTAMTLLLAAGYAAPALADRDPNSGAPLPPKQHEVASPITDHFAARASYFSPSLHTTVRADPTFGVPGALGTTINAEQDLGLPDKLHKGRVDFMFRMRERMKLRLDYFEADRSGSQVLSQDITFKNATFQQGLPASSSMDWQQFNITFTYSFIRTERFEVGTGLAAYFLQTDAKITQPQPFSIALHEELSGASPFPALPLDLTWCISRRWSVSAYGAYVHANVSSTDGWFMDMHADLQYRYNANFVVGAGYASTRASLTSTSSSNPGYVNTSISGSELFIRFSF